MSTINFFTEGGLPKIQKNDGIKRTMTSLQEFYYQPESQVVVLRHNHSITSDFKKSDTIKIEGATLSGTDEENEISISEWFYPFFVEPPEGGGGTDSFDSQSFTATSNQTQFTTTFDLPSESKRVKVFVNTNGVIVGVPFSKSGNTVTISARTSGENIIVEKI